MNEGKPRRPYGNLREQGGGTKMYSTGFPGSGPVPPGRPGQLFDGAPRGTAALLPRGAEAGQFIRPVPQSSLFDGRPRPPLGPPLPNFQYQAAQLQGGPMATQMQAPFPGGQQSPVILPGMPPPTQQMWRPPPPRPPMGGPRLPPQPAGPQPLQQGSVPAQPPLRPPQVQRVPLPGPPPRPPGASAAESLPGNAEPLASAGEPLDKPGAESPEGSPPPVPEEGRPDEALVSRSWTAHKSDDGQVYYFNPVTNKSSWSKPDGFTGEATEAVPTSQLRVPGTNWHEVHCEHGRKYYYNDQTEETSWAPPPEVLAVKQHVKDAKSAPPTAAIIAANKKRGANGLLQDHEEVIEDVTYTEDDIAPPLPVEAPQEPPPLPAESAPPVLPSPSKEQLTSDFHDLLAEKGVTPFSRWERELPKLLSDERYQAVPLMKDRKQMFENFCKSSAEYRKRANAQPPPSDPGGKESFKSLLAEAASTVQQLKEGEGEDGESSSRNLLQADTSYSSLESHFSADPRWQACSEVLRRELFDAHTAQAKTKQQQDAKKEVEVLESDFRALLASTGIGSTSRWSKSKDALSKDARYKAMTKESRERIFRDFVAQQKITEELKTKEKRQKEKKELESKQRLRREEEEAEKRRKKAAHTDALANYLTLLNEAVKDPDAHWSEWKSKLQRDPQGRGSNAALESKELEGRFRDHVNELHKKACTSFVGLLDEVVKPLLPAAKSQESPMELRTFSSAEKLWREDLRASKLSSKEREKLWRRYVDELLLQRDNPDAARHSRLIGRSKEKERQPVLRDDKEQRDKAYDREYLAHDRKRLRRE